MARYPTNMVTIHLGTDKSNGDRDLIVAWADIPGADDSEPAVRTAAWAQKQPGLPLAAHVKMVTDALINDLTRRGLFNDK